MRGLAAVVGVPALAVAALVTAPSAWAWTSTPSAAHAVATATLGAPPNVDCTSTTGQASPITFVWDAPAALAGKPTGPLTYSVDRRAGAGAWSTVATGLTTRTYSDNPSGLLALGTVWEYRVRAHYGAWTSPVSASVAGSYTSVLLVTVLTTCTP